MRQIYSSPRISNIDRVVALMAENGIETKVSNLRPWKRADWKRFSYVRMSSSDSWPKVSVVNSVDQTEARRLLRELGIAPATRYADALHQAQAPRPAQWRMRLRIVLLFAIAIIVGLIVFSTPFGS